MVKYNIKNIGRLKPTRIFEIPFNRCRYKVMHYGMDDIYLYLYRLPIEAIEQQWGITLAARLCHQVS
jgi:hypothetical protein